MPRAKCIHLANTSSIFHCFEVELHMDFNPGLKGEIPSTIALASTLGKCDCIGSYVHRDG